MISPARLKKRKAESQTVADSIEPTSEDAILFASNSSGEVRSQSQSRSRGRGRNQGQGQGRGRGQSRYSRDFRQDIITANILISPSNSPIQESLLQLP